MKRFIFTLLFVSSMTACTGVNDLSREDYRRGILLIEPVAATKIVVLPMRAPRANRDYVRAAETILIRSLTEMRGQNGQLQIVPPDESRDVPEALFGGATADRAVFESDMEALMARFGTPFFLQTELAQVEMVEGATQVRIRGRLWDVEAGDILWEASGESRGYVFLFFPTVPAGFERIAEAASRGLIRKMPTFRAEDSDRIP